MTADLEVFQPEIPTFSTESADFCLSQPSAMELGIGDQSSIEILDGMMVLNPVRDTFYE